MRYCVPRCLEAGFSGFCSLPAAKQSLRACTDFDLFLFCVFLIVIIGIEPTALRFMTLKIMCVRFLLAS